MYSRYTDSVIAGKGYDICMNYLLSVKLNIPPFVRGSGHMSKSNRVLNLSISAGVRGYQQKLEETLKLSGKYINDKKLNTSTDMQTIIFVHYYDGRKVQL